MRGCALVRGIDYGLRNLPLDRCLVLAESARRRTAAVSFPIGKQSVVEDFAPKREGISTPVLFPAG